MRALRYFFDEALASLWRGYKTGLIAVATIAAALFVLGGFLLLTSNMERLFARWQEAAEFSVYLRDDVDAGAAGRHRQRAAREPSGPRRRGRVEGRGAQAVQAELRRRWRRPPAICPRIRSRPRSKCGSWPTADPADVEILADRVVDARRRGGRAIRPSAGFSGS